MPLRVIVDNDVLDEVAAIAAGNSDRYLKIISDLNDLGLEPEPDTDGWRATSARVVFLWKAGYKVRRLTLKTTLPGHRFFYLHDADHSCVFVMEVALRDDKTYDKMSEPHIQRLRRKYDDYYGRQLWAL
jgi:hypothetical protein